MLGPEVRVFQPPLDGVTQELFGLAAHEGELQGGRVGLPHDGVKVFDQVAEPPQGGLGDAAQVFASREVNNGAPEFGFQGILDLLEVTELLLVDADLLREVTA